MAELEQREHQPAQKRHRKRAREDGGKEIQNARSWSGHHVVPGIRGAMQQECSAHRPARQPCQQECGGSGIVGQKRRGNRRKHQDGKAAHEPVQVGDEIGPLVFILERGLEGGNGVGDGGVVGLLQLDGIARREQLARHRALAIVQACGALALAGAGERVGMIGLADFHVALHRHVDQRCGEGFAVVAHAMHEPHRGRRKILRRREQRNDGAAAGIAAELEPGGTEIDEKDEDAGDGHDSACVVADELRAPFGRGRRQHRALGESDSDREPFIGVKRHRGPAMQRAAAQLLAMGIIGAGSRRTGVGRILCNARTNGQVDRRFGAVNGKLPEISRDVPVKLVVSIVEPDLPVRGIGDRVGVRSGIEFGVGAADLDALAAFDGGEIVRLVMAVARDVQHVEADMHAPAEFVRVGSGEVPEDAVADAVAFGYHRNRFGDGERPVARHVDAAVVTGDALFGRCRADKERE